MRIEKVRIRNLRAFDDETVFLDDYSCLVGSNGAGKSTVLCALNIFFREIENASTDLSKLEQEDFHGGQIDQPIEVTVTFFDLSVDEIEAFSDYYRQDRLVVTARAVFDTSVGYAVVKQYGSRLVMPDFAPYFDGMKIGKPAAELKQLFEELREKYPGINAASTKDARAEALQLYEAGRSDLCEPILSEDQFYGIGQAGKLRRHVQWVYVPAVKDAAGEQAEAKNSAFGKLVARTVRANVNFSDPLAALRAEAEDKYRQLIESHQDALNDVSARLQERLAEWSTPNATAKLNWHQDPKSAVRVEEPTARLIAGDGIFEGNISRFGHGLQRSYIIALLEGIASVDDSKQPRLILGIEEPELYQHPPQARHLASVLEKLASSNAQVILSTHSPLFVDGRGFENVRLVQKDVAAKRSHVRQMTLEALSKTLSDASGKQAAPVNGMLAKLHQALQPALSEIFFSHRLVLVEGLEDHAYITAWMKLTGRWEAFRRGGAHIVPVGGKSEMPRPLAIANGMQIPVYAMFDADIDKVDHSNPQRAAQLKGLHENDNGTILNLIGADVPIFPDENVISNKFTVWATDFAGSIKADVSVELWGRYGDEASASLGHESGLNKNTLHIAGRLFQMHADQIQLPLMDDLCDRIVAFALDG